MRSPTDIQKISIFAVAMLVIACAVPASAARPETFTTINISAANVTVASGINNDGFIVGWYCFKACSPSAFRGFLRDPDGTPHDIIVPNEGSHPAIGTQPRYISPQGVVIGDYLTLEDGATSQNPRFRGFACFASSCWGPDAQFLYFDAPPDALYDNPSPPYPHSIIPRAINAHGDLVGCIHDQDQGNSMHGFRLHDGVFTRNVDSMTMNNGVNSRGDIVGLDNNFTGYHIDQFGNVERLNLPDAGPNDFVNAWDINDKGEIVGQAFTNGGTVGHAFLRSKGTYRLIDPAGAVSAVAFAIAGNGSIVGQFRDSHGTHAFLLQRGVEGEE